MLGNKILILYGYDKHFALSIKKPGSARSMDINVLKECFENDGYYVNMSSFSELDLTRNLSGWFVIYASSEQRGLFYKDYIEDVLLSIKQSGGILLPDFKYFRAHHNKSFAEMLRLSFKKDELKTISSKSFGSYYELRTMNYEINYPVVIKTSAGSGSNGVKLANNYNELIKISKNMNKITYFDFWYKFIMFNSVMMKLKVVKALLTRRPVHSYYYSPLYSNKFIIQKYIKDLKGDFKVLVFFDKYFILNRGNRDNGFTASGSGKFVFPTETDEIKDILDLAKLTHEELNTPISSIDIARNGDGCHLIEFQCLFFGPYTLQFSPCYFIKENNEWIKISKEANLEKEYCRAISMYINSYKNKQMN